jgi:hypothetical protein
MKTAIEIPDRMKHLKLDARGYPIPCMVLIDKTGLPHFAVNEETERVKVIRNDLCSVCGTKLFRGRWFVGGALSAFHEHGAFFDPPMHSECAKFSLKVCPYLAAPRYDAEIGIAKAKAKADAGAMPNHLVFVDHTMIPGRPMDDMFVALMTTKPVILCGEDFRNLKAQQPYNAVEYWRRGERISDREGQAIVKRALEDYKKTEPNDAYERHAG